MEIVWAGYRMLVPDDVGDDGIALARALLRAYAKFYERNKKRKGVWRRAGLKGQTVNWFSKAERAMQQLFAGDYPDADHYEDGIVYAGFGLAMMGEASSDEPVGLEYRKVVNGDWPWEG